MTLYQNWEMVEHRQAVTEAELWQLDSSSHDNSFYRRRVKRVVDVSLAIVMLAVLALPMIIVALLLLITQGRPIIYSGARMKAPGEPFKQFKFRTMVRVTEDGGATGAHKNWRITPLGRILRRTRLDELPQLFNILIGDMSFVGPRPPLPEYVARFPSLYGAVLTTRPGVTGLATLIYHRHEDRIMAGCKTAEQTERAYYARCLPTKLRIELVYQRAASPWLDAWIMWKTFLALIPGFDRPRKKRGSEATRQRSRRPGSAPSK
ncbi:sugar transferase [Paracoccus sediminicola]|uniref:sugar transferase n=1 Tax=Paracoccus sediminicola TaxID=3017783 RepID=UPI0022EFF084|nr:sugar transferase [Paracoccus sediminicola]WBU56019.1 sugar transferase [Paracoccus sediminicola]